MILYLYLKYYKKIINIYHIASSNSTMASQFFKKVFKQIYENQQGYKVQTSIHLKKIQEYLFGKTCPKLNHNDLEILFIGFPQDKIMGLYALAGIKGTVSGLKKSSHYALQIIYKVVTTGKNAEVTAKYFSESDEQDFKLCRLATHILQDKSKIALELCGILKDKRPYLSQNNYIYSQDAKSKFQKWYKERPKTKKTDQKKPTLRKQNNQEGNGEGQQGFKNTIPLVANTNHFQHKNNSKHKDISTDLSELQFWDFDVIMTQEDQYLIDSFLDPIDIWQFKKQNVGNRDKVGYKQYMLYLIENPISQVNPSLISERIKSIHIQSEQFNPAILMEKYHKDMSEDQRKQLGKQIPHHIGSDSKKNIVKYFFSQFLEMQHNIGLIKNNFDETQKIRNQGNIGFSLRTKTKNSMKNLSAQVEPLHRKYLECEKLRKLILFLEQNSEFTRLSSTLVTLIEQNKINQIPLLYARYQNLIEAYRDKPILRTIIENIENNLLQARIKQINAVLQHGIDKKQADILIGLFKDKKGILREYIVPKIVFHVLNRIHYTNSSQNNNTKQLNQLQTKIKKFQLINFQQLVPIKHKTQYGQLNQQEGDLLELFLNTNNKTKKQSQQAVDYFTQCLNFEEQIQSELAILYQLITSWQIKYNIFFEEKQLLIKLLIQLSGYITQQIKQALNNTNDEKQLDKDSYFGKQQRCIEIVCRMLLMTEKYIQNRELSDKMQILKLNNFELFCKVLSLQTQKHIDFKPCPIKRDFDKNYYNQILVCLIGDILAGCQHVLKYPSFMSSHSEKYQNILYNYICESFEIDDILLGQLPEILTYACVVNSIIEDHFLQPFYNQLRQFGGLRKQLQERTKKKSRRVKQLLNSYIKIQYCALIITKKYQNFALDVLDILNQHIFLISEYANNNYKNLSRFFMESFLNQCEKLVKDSKTKLKNQFYEELIIIKSMTTKIRSKRVDQRWTGILNGVNLDKNVLNKLQTEIFKMKYRNSITFKALIE